jgi:hypothetical protein
VLHVHYHHNVVVPIVIVQVTMALVLNVYHHILLVVHVMFIPVVPHLYVLAMFVQRKSQLVIPIVNSMINVSVDGVVRLIINVHHHHV